MCYGAPVFSIGHVPSCALLHPSPSIGVGVALSLVVSVLDQDPLHSRGALQILPSVQS